MELIENGPAYCDCQAKLKTMEKNLNEDGTFLYIKAIARCDCGRVYLLCDDQREGRCWRESSIAI